MKVFRAIQFISLRELAFWAGYSFLYIGNSLTDTLIHEAGDTALAGYLPVAADVLCCFSVAFYLLPAVAGVLVAVLVRLLMITATDGGAVLLYERHPAGC